MRFFPLIGGIITAVFFSIPAQAGQKVDPFLGMFPPSSSHVQSGGASKAMVVSQPVYDVFIKTNDVQSTREAIEKLGGEVRITVGGIITASIPVGSVGDLAQREEVVFIEAAKPISAKNDLAMTDINGDEVHNGVELPSALTGKNAIVGIVDTGVDYTHPDFLDQSGKSRILFLWDQMSMQGPGPAEIGNTYGIECDGDDIAEAKCPTTDDSGHGTHILGTAAGRNDEFGGVAPDAFIIAVRYKAEVEFDSGYANPVFSTTICEGAYYVFKKAEELGLPAVVNLSLGSHIGPHDGTSLFEECLDGLVEGSKGRAIIVAVGNESSSEDYFTGLHAGYAVNGDAATNFTVRNFSAGRTIYVDIWGEAGSNLSFGLQLNEGAAKSSSQTLGQSDMAEMGDSKEGSFLGGKISYVINATETNSPLNGKPHVGILLTFSNSITRPEQYNFDLMISGNGSFDAWLFPDKPSKTINFTAFDGRRGSRKFIAGDSAKSVAIPATAKNVIAVAAYATRNRWDMGDGCCQVAYTVGDLLGFSSMGPTADPSFTGQKPEIAAPGGMIVSAMSSDTTAEDVFVMPDGRHMLMAGTSMAAPFVAGTVALLFSANPNYTYTDIENYLTQSAYVDKYVGEAPNDRWGYGKLDVYAAVEAAISGGASGSATDNSELTSLDETVTDNSSGSSSCRLNPAAQSHQSTAILIMFVLTIIGVILNRFVILSPPTIFGGRRIP